MPTHPTTFVFDPMQLNTLQVQECGTSTQNTGLRNQAVDDCTLNLAVLCRAALCYAELSTSQEYGVSLMCIAF